MTDPSSCPPVDVQAPGVLMLDLQGPVLQDDEQALLRSPCTGGVILFARNFVDPQQLLALVASIRACRPNLLIAVDQEGGRVQRLRNGFTRLPPMRVFTQSWQQDPRLALQQARQCGWLMAAEVLAYGIDFSFAPVLDLDSGLSAVIGDRAFSSDPDQVTAIASAFMQGMHEAGMATTGKHFPGHGSVAADSHTDLPVDSRPLAQIREQDLVPFRQCSGVLDAVMPAHVIYEQADPRCAGFSPFWLQTVLRGELGFDGVIFSDDLVMAGAAAAGSMEQRVDAALEAGCDMVLVCNDRTAALQALAHLERRGQGEENSKRRLLRMAAREQWNPERLHGSPQWQAARQTIESLLEAKDGDRHA